MTQTLLATGLTLEVTSCCMCGVEFAVPAKMIAEKREIGGSLYCPNGHCLTWGDTELKRIRRKLAVEQQRLNTQKEYTRVERERCEATERRLSATKGVLTKTKKRVGGGACPCCNRWFQKLADHMKCKHPQYKKG